MHPVIFTIPWLNRPVPTFGLMLVLGFLAAVMWAARRAQRSGGNPEVILDCGFVALIAGVVGARAMYVIHYWPHFAVFHSPLAIAWAVVDVTQGGLEYYGGVVLSIVAVIALLAWRRQSVRWYLDIVAPSVVLGLAFGRVGCFLNGCCFGGVCDAPWAVRFPFGSNPTSEQWRQRVPGTEVRKELLVRMPGAGFLQPIDQTALAASDDAIAAADRREAQARRVVAELKAKVAAADAARQPALREELTKAEKERLLSEAALMGVRSQMRRYNVSAAQLRAWAQESRGAPVHPAQLYSTITALVIAYLLSALYWRRSHDGVVFFSMLVLEPPARCLLELIRTDNPVDTLGALTISQFIAIVMILIGIAGLLIVRRLPPRSPAAVRWAPDEPGTKAKGKPRHAAATG
jgi:phosphatidylglycerol:prolipoprotein diacylglycerol transferase